MVDLKGQYSGIKEQVDSSILNVIESAAFINGPEVHGFQKKWHRCITNSYDGIRPKAWR